LEVGVPIDDDFERLSSVVSQAGVYRPANGSMRPPEEIMLVAEETGVVLEEVLRLVELLEGLLKSVRCGCGPDMILSGSKCSCGAEGC